MRAVRYYQRDKAKNVLDDIASIRKRVPVMLKYIEHDENRIYFQPSCTCKHQHDIAYCDLSCQEG